MSDWAVEAASNFVNERGGPLISCIVFRRRSSHAGAAWAINHTATSIKDIECVTLWRLFVMFFVWVRSVSKMLQEHCEAMAVNVISDSDDERRSTELYFFRYCAVHVSNMQGEVLPTSMICCALHGSDNNTK